MGESLFEGSSLSSQGFVACDDIRRKVSPLVKEFAQVKGLVPVFVLLKDFFNRLNFVGWNFCICDAHIQNEISAPCVEATAHDIPSKCLLMGEGG